MTNPTDTYIEEFEKRYGGFIATKQKREWQDKANDWLRTALQKHRTEVRNATLDEVLGALEGKEHKPSNQSDGALAYTGAYNRALEEIRDTITTLKEKGI